MDSALKYATSSIQCFPDGKGFCVGSIEGRCSVKFCDFSQSDRSDNKSFCFKCHRKEEKQNGQSVADVFSVNGFCFNKKHDTFYSFGGNGEWVSWNKDTRAKYKSNAERMVANQTAPPIVAGDQTEDASMFAYAIGYDWSQGMEGSKQRQFPNKLILRCPDQDETWKPSNTVRR